MRRVINFSDLARIMNLFMIRMYSGLSLYLSILLTDL